MGNKKKLVVLIGPTAVGKTKTSIELAKHFNGEIISGDSMQIYKGMDIGTAKITKDEMDGIQHHLIDIKAPNESFSAAEFQQIVREKIIEISSRGKLPMIVGGTGLYIQSVLYDYQFSEAPSDERYRQELEKKAIQNGNAWLHKELMKLDPKSGENIHPNNVRRVIRAMEIFHCTGKTMTDYQETQTPEKLYDAAIIGLTMERDKLYERINHRVDVMMENGLLNEVQNLYKMGMKDCQSIQAIGYKELYEFFNGYVSLEEAIVNLKQNSRRYAKRQLTWFRNKMDVSWFDMTDASDEAVLRKKINEISREIEGKLKI
ncbi:tRNA dimethylallyltransferase [Cytobacillus horneckiae]|uniref:tRNA dimethylallyltransferase n=1 Tax=Cytobacillus horneckiae TaxID=549687 RepID=A0A2N0ZLS3_9BACI|nr:tRNA (adenosine(37)-N6)-dimethylallyltransferase MiaA [Cytobacillus horneckiae]MBN6887264.1 tRNA (adenosine(37)-N6)-dimethylallyltransferase MiaA [Cytobacillus horneckiae]MCM3178145.1 tRNA (adenosine(37)-N6)-dimethylallyltransferase MiaA [Cytobacillus horneckiae]MEC1157113.1 tRNA (adenosine(37)-N6)-dimethylallyltransferase MiaA [Cytobacillus horneckiae]MED2939861.1 tRNA (adenosine(37)-N6)-dimethylallyltransferase MiaA [Cytobacillus horneckiae]PKG30464.1 tRNA (adenosine(37)-N6)-dimethylallyl